MGLCIQRREEREREWMSEGDREEGKDRVFICVIMVELKPSHATEDLRIGKIKDSLIALLVLMIEFRREEERGE